jgi:hypothetical protein
VVVATCVLTDCLPVGDPLVWGRLVIWPAERGMGDFSPGRFAWLLADIVALEPPVPARGRLGLWEWPAGQ